MGTRFDNPDLCELAHLAWTAHTRAPKTLVSWIYEIDYELRTCGDKRWFYDAWIEAVPARTLAEELIDGVYDPAAQLPNYCGSSRDAAIYGVLGHFTDKAQFAAVLRRINKRELPKALNVLKEHVLRDIQIEKDYRKEQQIEKAKKEKENVPIDQI